MTLTELVVKIGADMSDFNKSMSSVTERLSDVGQKMQSVGTKMSIGLTAPIVAGGAAMVKLASDAEEMQGKFNVVFANTGTGVTAALSSFAEEVGRSRFELLGMAAEFGDVLKPLGFLESDAADTSVQLTKLAADLASFNDMPMDEALARLRGTLVGSHENALAFGVVINENALKAEMMEQGYDKLTGAALEQAKVQARINLLLKGTTDAQGDAARTADSFANQSRALFGALSDLGTEMGQFLLPIMSSVVGALRGAVSWFSDLDDGTKKIILTIAAVVAAIGPLVAVFGTILTLLPAMSAGFAILSASGGPIFLTVAAVAALVAGAVALYQNWDEVTAFIQESWLRLKLTVISGVAEMLDGFAGFARFIPGVGDAVEVAASLMRQKTGEAALALSKFKIEQEQTKRATDATKEAAQQAAPAVDALAGSFVNAAAGAGVATESVSDFKAEVLDMEDMALKQVEPLRDVGDVMEGIPQSLEMPDWGLIEPPGETLSAIDALKTRFAQVTGSIRQSLGGVFDSLTGANGLKGALGTIGGILGGQGTFGGALQGVLGNLGSKGLGGIVGGLAGTAFPGLGVAMGALGPIMDVLGIDAKKIIGDIGAAAASAISNIFGIGQKAREQARERERFAEEFAALGIDPTGDLSAQDEAAIRAILTGFQNRGIVDIAELLESVGLTESDIQLDLSDFLESVLDPANLAARAADAVSQAATFLAEGETGVLGDLARRFGVDFQDLLDEVLETLGVTAEQAQDRLNQLRGIVDEEDFVSGRPDPIGDIGRGINDTIAAVGEDVSTFMNGLKPGGEVVNTGGLAFVGSDGAASMSGSGSQVINVNIDGQRMAAVLLPSIEREIEVNVGR